MTASHIGVSADAGVVTRTGHGETFAEKVAAEQAALRVRGVKAVAEEIGVQLPFERKRDDADRSVSIRAPHEGRLYECC